MNQVTCTHCCAIIQERSLYRHHNSQKCRNLRGLVGRENMSSGVNDIDRRSAVNWIRRHDNHLNTYGSFEDTSAKKCGHLCTLSGAMKTCCHCSDKRPYEDTYFKYTDGVGDTRTATRWQYYCPVCEDGILLALLSWSPTTHTAFPFYIQRAVHAIMSTLRYEGSLAYNVPVDVVYLIVTFYVQKLVRELRS